MAGLHFNIFSLCACILTLWISFGQASSLDHTDASILRREEDECCFTSVPTMQGQETFLLNVSVYWQLAASTMYHYEVTVNFPSTYLMNAAQPYRAPLGTVQCSNTPTFASKNIWACTSRDASILSAQFSMITPGNPNLTPDVSLQFRNSEGQYNQCSLGTWCPSVLEKSDDGLLNFGPFGRKPKWFAVVLAAGGGIILSLIAFGLLYLRGQRSALHSEVAVARRHEGPNGKEAPEMGIAVPSLKRVPTIREAGHGTNFAGSGTLLGNLPNGGSSETLRPSKNTLVGGMLHQAHLDAPLEPAQPLTRTKSMRSVRSVRSVQSKDNFAPSVSDDEQLPTTDVYRTQSKRVHPAFATGDTWAPSELQRSKSIRSAPLVAVTPTTQDRIEAEEIHLKRSMSTKSVQPNHDLPLLNSDNSPTRNATQALPFERQTKPQSRRDDDRGRSTHLQEKGSVSRESDRSKRRDGFSRSPDPYRDERSKRSRSRNPAPDNYGVSEHDRNHHVYRHAPHQNASSGQDPRDNSRSRERISDDTFRHLRAGSNERMLSDKSSNVPFEHQARRRRSTRVDDKAESLRSLEQSLDSLRNTPQSHGVAPMPNKTGVGDQNTAKYVQRPKDPKLAHRGVPAGARNQFSGW
ncbi:hypothetical protein DFS34DRAFT_631150 [Phlyctochytrium arcticum]|nr:hypothetical protein DFS34DRAFT_631150 [Phlyctochytrium arcticum]